MNQFSQNLRFLRKKGNHNQDEIALLFNKRANTIGNWENQKSEPSLNELMKLADFFKISTEDLLQKDLESRQTTVDGPSVSGNPTAKDVPSPEMNMIRASEAETETFWMILRELRALHAKVDLLTAGIESAGLKKNSDKSYH